MFNTLGNFEIDSRAGIAVPDFERGRVLELTGRVRLIFSGQESSHPSGGTGRYWDFEVERFVETSLPREFRWEYLEASPYNP